MTLADCTSSMFVMLNAARVIAYIPQMVRVTRDTDGARAVSIATWMLFGGANLATMAYALIVVRDLVIATLFGLSSLGSVAIVALTLWKRHRWRSTQNQVDPTPAALPEFPAAPFGRSGDLLLRAAKHTSSHVRSIAGALGIVVALLSAFLLIPA